jgi:cation diffusion facilitator CzcD-associated flavoprotein CzcO
MDGAGGAEHFETVIIGGGQAGLSVGYHLARRGRRFVILDANQRVGDPWRTRWDSLRLFTPARYDGLPGWPFPAPAWSFPTKDEVADYLEAYAARFDLPVRTGVRVDGLSRQADRYVVAAGDRRLEADHVVVAAGAYQRPRVPAFAPQLDPGIVQLLPASTGVHPSCRRAASWSSAPPTRGPRSPWRCPGTTGPGCRAGTRAKNPSAPEAGRFGSSSRWSGSWPRAC